MSQKKWWEDERVLGSLSLRLMQFDDPKRGLWIICGKCGSAVWCLNRAGGPADPPEPPPPGFEALECDTGCNAAAIENPPAEVLTAMLDEA